MTECFFVPKLHETNCVSQLYNFDHVNIVPNVFYRFYQEELVFHRYFFLKYIPCQPNFCLEKEVFNFFHQLFPIFYE